jgi:hypothetical protein
MTGAGSCSVIVVIILGASLACAPYSRSTSQRVAVDRAEDDAPRVRQPDHIIGSAEIEATHAFTAYEAVRRLRPDLLTLRAAFKPGDPDGGAPVVYLDRVRQGGLEMLESIGAGAIVDIRYLGASAANDLVGAFHPGGVILVRSRR